MLSPSLSVIIANYNNENYIRECLDSILNQTYKNLEIIVSDDASDDDSPSVIRQYEEMYPGIVKGIFNPVNRGVAATRHEAILQANTEYITTLDSDDYFYDAVKLEKEMEMVARCKKETGMDILAFSNIVLVKEEESRTETRVWGNSNNIKDGFIFAGILSRTCMIPRDFIMKRSAYLEVGGYDPSIPIYEDWDLKLRLAHRYEFRYCDVKGTAYRRHGSGLSSASLPEHNKWLNHIFNKNLPLSEPSERGSIVQKFREFLTRMNKTRN